MSAISSQPLNKNFLSPIGFIFNINRLTHVNYFCVAASIPGITLGALEFDTPFVKIPMPGDKLTYEPLNVRFKIDEDLKNYSEIFNWMVGLGYPESFEQRYPQFRTPSTTNEYSDASLIVLATNNKPVLEIKFKDVFPIALSSLEFNTEQTTVEYLGAETTFAYKSYSLTPITL
jgi:hypothetical protein